MRIIGGRLRGLKLAEIGSGDDTARLRPTSDRVREAMFNLLINSIGLNLDGLRVLDLFAGTGAIGLEAMSRGAAHVTFVDNGATAQALLGSNIDRAKARSLTRMRLCDATKLGENPGPAFDLIAMDPPYGQSLGETALDGAQRGGWLAEGAIVLWEDNAPPAVPRQFTALDQRRYGDTVVTILRYDRR